jgi:hypothetical protein
MVDLSVDRRSLHLASLQSLVRLYLRRQVRGGGRGSGRGSGGGGEGTLVRLYLLRQVRSTFDGLATFF